MSPSTVSARYNVVVWAARLADTGVTELQQLVIVRYVGRPNLAQWSRRIYFLHLREWHRWLVAQGARQDNPTDGLKAPKSPRMVPRPMSDAQLSHALATAGPRTFVYLTLAAYAGMRAGEVAAIRGQDVGEVIVIQGKGSVMRMVPVHPRIEALRASHDPEGYWFPGSDHGHVRARSVSLLVTKHLKRQGLPVSLHSARHWFGTCTLRASGGNLRVTQELLGHASPATTAGYTFITSIERSAAVAALPDVGRSS